MRISCLILGFLLGVGVTRAEAPSLLFEAVTHWSGERNNWAFTQHVTEYDGNEVKQERLETFDPSRPENKRWALLKLDGRAPTTEEWTKWDKRKNKKRRRDPKPLMEYFDFEHARLLKDEGQVAIYELPLKSSSGWLFPADKVDLQIGVNRGTRAVEKVEARISEPFKVALGLARVLNFELDLVMQPAPGDAPAAAADPAKTQPDGKMHAVVNKFGQRVEYRWDEFRRVKPNAELRQEAGLD